MPRTPQKQMDDITRWLDFLRGNTPDVSPDKTREENCRIVARKNQSRFQNRQIRERERELKNIPKGIINKRKSTLNFNFPDTPPYTPPQDNFLRYLQLSSSTPAQDDFSSYLQPSLHFHLCFLFSDGTNPESLSPLRNKLKNIAPLPSKPTIDNFARPITQMSDEKNNTIAITPKRPVPKIEETNLSEQLQSIFPDDDETIERVSETFKEKIDDLDKIIEKVSNIDDNQDEQKLFEFEFFTGKFNQKFDYFVRKFGLLTEN